MARRLLGDITKRIQKAKFFTLMADEATDAGNKEQLVIVLRWVDENLNVHEDFVGLHEIDVANADFITSVIQNVLAVCNLNVHQLRGQCYDGASVMAGLRNGLQLKFKQWSLKQYTCTHCYGHALNLVAGYTIKNCLVLKKALDITLEMSK